MRPPSRWARAGYAGGLRGTRGRRSSHELRAHMSDPLRADGEQPGGNFANSTGNRCIPRSHRGSLPESADVNAGKLIGKCRRPKLLPAFGPPLTFTRSPGDWGECFEEVGFQSKR